MLTRAQCHIIMTCGYICSRMHHGQYSEKDKIEVKLGMMENALVNRPDQV